MALSSHYFVGENCLYCRDAGAEPGAPCAARAAREREVRAAGAYDPEQALRAAAFRIAWPDLGRVRIERTLTTGANTRVRFRVLRDGVVLADAAETGVEQAARVTRELIEPFLAACPAASPAVSTPRPQEATPPPRGAPTRAPPPGGSRRAPS